MIRVGNTTPQEARDAIAALDAILDRDRDEGRPWNEALGCVRNEIQKALADAEMAMTSPLDGEVD